MKLSIIFTLLCLLFIIGCTGWSGNSGSSSYSDWNSTSSDDFYTGRGSGSTNSWIEGNGWMGRNDDSPNIIPEPSTIVLFTIGLGGLAYSTFRKRRQRVKNRE